MISGERILEIAAKIAPVFPIIGGIAAVGSAAYVWHVGAPSGWVWAGWVLGGATVVLLVLAVIFITKYLRNRSDVTSALVARTAADQRLLSAVSALNEILGLDYEHCEALRAGSGSVDADKIAKEFQSYVNNLLQQVAQFFTLYTGHECAACVKAISQFDDKQVPVRYARAGRNGPAPLSVYTLARDPGSRRKRSFVDSDPKLRVYRWEGNAAFAHVMHSKPARGYFVSNDLNGMGGKYWNDNDRWREFYNAAAVAALKCPSSDEATDVLGFLCVDNMGGGFDDTVCREILECIASIVYYSLQVSTDAMTATTGGSE